MIHCCLCEYSDAASIAAHVRDHHNLTRKAYAEMFPGMPLGSLEGFAETLPERNIRRSRIVRHQWWPIATVLVMVWNGDMIRSLHGNTVTGVVVNTDKFISGRGIHDRETGQVHASPTGWVRARAPWITSPNGGKIVNPISKEALWKR